MPKKNTCNQINSNKNALNKQKKVEFFTARQPQTAEQMEQLFPKTVFSEKEHIVLINKRISLLFTISKQNQQVYKTQQHIIHNRINLTKPLISLKFFVVHINLKAA